MTGRSYPRPSPSESCTHIPSPFLFGTNCSVHSCFVCIKHYCVRSTNFVVLMRPRSCYSLTLVILTCWYLDVRQHDLHVCYRYVSYFLFMFVDYYVIYVCLRRLWLDGCHLPSLDLVVVVDKTLSRLSRVNQLDGGHILTVGKSGSSQPSKGVSQPSMIDARLEPFWTITGSEEFRLIVNDGHPVKDHYGSPLPIKSLDWSSIIGSRLWIILAHHCRQGVWTDRQ